MNHNKSLILLTGTAIDFPKGYPSTKRLKEIGLTLKNMNYGPLLIPLGASKMPNSPVKGNYQGVRFRYLFAYRNIKKNNSSLINVFIRRYYSAIASFVLSFLIIKKRNKILFVFSCTTSLFAISTISAACFIGNVPFIYDVVENPLAVLRSRKISELSNKDKINLFLAAVKIPFIYLIFWRLPNYLTCITLNQINYLKKLGYKNERLLLLPIIKHEQKEKSTELRHSGPRYILYSGSLTFSKDGLDKMIKAIGILKNRGANVKLKIFGFGNSKEIKLISNLVIELKLSELVSIEGFVQEEKLSSEQHNAFLLLLLKNNSPQNRYNLATKLIDYLGTGRPILMSSLETHREYFEDCKNAFLVDCNDIEVIADKLMFILKNPELAEQIGNHGKELLLTKFSAEKNIRIIIQKVCEKT